MNGLTALAGTAAETAGRELGKIIDAIGTDVAKDTDDAKWATPGVPKPGGSYATGAPYAHDRPANDPNQGFSGAAWGGAKPLLATVPDGFSPPPGRNKGTKGAPGAVVDTAHYRDDFAKVAAKGILDRHSICTADTRTPWEETIGIFWGYDGPQELGTPPRLYMQVTLAILDNVDVTNSAALSEYDALQMVAAIAVAMADAGIAAWHYKYSADHMMWRPCLGIPRAVPGNGTADSLWEPLGRPDTNGTGVGLTPDFPAYPSGHATFGAAAFELLRLMMVQKGRATFDPGTGLDNIHFNVTSDEFDGRNIDPRTRQPRDLLVLGYRSLWKAITDNSISRVYLGVHWQFDGITMKGDDGGDAFGVPQTPNLLGTTGGVWLGCHIAHQIARKVSVTAATLAASKVL